MSKHYALYRGDKFLVQGTIKEIAKYMGVKESTIMFYQSPNWKKRRGENGLLLIKVDSVE